MLKSYIITAIDQEKGHITIDFTFELEGKEEHYIKTYMYDADVAYDDFEPVEQEEKYLDENKEVQTRTVQVAKRVTRFRKMFSVNDKDKLDAEIKAIANAYLAGKKQSVVTQPSEDVLGMVKNNNLQ